jgi:hypothetical protein
VDGYAGGWVCGWMGRVKGKCEMEAIARQRYSTIDTFTAEYHIAHIIVLQPYTRETHRERGKKRKERQGEKDRGRERER